MPVAIAIIALSLLIGLVLFLVYSKKMSAEEQPTTHVEDAQPAVTEETTTTATEQKPTDAQPSASAKKNKANSYYYWHGHEKERAKLGDVAPMPTPHLVSKDDTVTVAIPVIPAISVSKYSWCDGEKFVSVYVETVPPASGETLDDASIEAVFTGNSFRLSFATTDKDGKRRTKQMVTRLSKRIDADRSSTKVKAKTQEILVKLAKKVPSVWLDLEGYASDRDSAADEPLEAEGKEEDDE
jgi:hypothetical protein